MEVEGLSLLTKYFSHFSELQLSQFRQLHELYMQWNQRINLISRRDTPYLYERHVLHSLAIFEHLPLHDQFEIADIGTGGGFPGIPLAIARPDLQFHLVDSIGKKINALRGIKEALGLDNVLLYNARIEDLQLPIACVVCRAVAKTGQILKWTKNLSLSDNLNDMFLLKGGNLSEELKSIRGWQVQILNLQHKFNETFFDSKVLLHLSAESVKRIW